LIYAQYRKLQYSSSNNTGNTSIVKHTILEAPYLQYWYFQYCEYYNTGNTSIVNITILVIPVSRPAASYYPNNLAQIQKVNLKILKLGLKLGILN
jgi:hypothetical protein